MDLALALSIVEKVFRVIPAVRNFFSKRETSWRKWRWSIDDDEINQEKFGYWQGIPFRDIRKLRHHPEYPNDSRQKSIDPHFLIDFDVDAKERRFFVKTGLMDDYVGNGSPYGDLCYCLYERKDGKNYIIRFFSSGKHKAKLRELTLLLDRHKARL